MTDTPPQKIILTAANQGEDDRILPFAIEAQDMRGRLLRLAPVLNQILDAHAYPEPVARVLAEVLTLTALLGSMLKVDGRLTVQTKSDGAIGLLVADYFDGGSLRGYAQFNETSLATYGKAASLRALTGRGYLALTLEQGGEGERYQGIVDLDGDTLSDCATNYFAQSEQTPTRLRLAVDRDETGWWRTGGLLLQHLSRGEEGGERLLSLDQTEDWNRVSTLMMSVRDGELLDPKLPSPDLLYRLFHEEGARIFQPIEIVRDCRCSHERLAAALSRFPREDLAHMAEDGVISANCEYCNTVYRFNANDL